MMHRPRYSVFLNTFNTCVDRFCTAGYSEKVSVAGQFAAARKLSGISAVDVVVYSDTRLDEIARQLAQGGLELASVLPDITCAPMYQHGAFTAPDPEVRRSAVQNVCRCMDFAAEHGCRSVTVWPGQDGYDYLFQSDYLLVYEQLKEGLAACAAHRSDVTLHIEYKPYEPRTHSYLDSCTSVLALIQSLPYRNLGVVIDFGHTLMNNCAPGQAVALCKAHGVDRLHLHLNDSFAHMDDDLIPGTAHTQYYLEFFYWLQYIGYEGYITFDQFPYRDNAAQAVEEARLWLDFLWERACSVEMQEVVQVLRRRDGIASSRLMRRMLSGK